MAVVVAFANRKGGVGKTTLAASVAGIAALAGWRVLAVDMDPQGNLGMDLGYYGSEVDDAGRGMFQAMALGSPLQVTCGVRERLDVVCGGQHTEEVSLLAPAWEASGRQSLGVLSDVLATVSDDYDLVVIDTPPGNRFLHESALVASRFVVIPTRSDDASIEGIGKLAAAFPRLREFNPSLEVLGVVLMGVNPSAAVLERTLRAKIDESLGGAAPVFDTVVHYREKSAAAARERGLLAHEYEEQVLAVAPRWYEPGGKADVAQTADRLAAELAELASEIMVRMSARVEAAA